MRVIAALALFVVVMASAPAHSDTTCDSMMGSIVKATGTVSDFTYLQSSDKSQFFIHDTNLPCHADLWVFVQGRIICSDGKTATILGKFDSGDLGTGTNAYLLLTDSDHARCK